MPIKSHSRTALACAIALALPACQTTPPATSVPAQPASAASRSASGGVSPALADAAARVTSTDFPDRTTIRQGSGVLVRGQAVRCGLLSAPPQAYVTGLRIVLTFEAADLR